MHVERSVAHKRGSEGSSNAAQTLLSSSARSAARWNGIAHTKPVKMVELEMVIADKTTLYIVVVDMALLDPSCWRPH